MNLSIRTFLYSSSFRGWLLLGLLLALPFLEILEAWQLSVHVLFRGLFMALVLLSLPSLSRHIRIQPAVALLWLWIFAATLRAPEWDRGFALYANWSMSLLIGLMVYALSREDDQYGGRILIAFWAMATLIAVVNPWWQIPLEQMEEFINSQLMDAQQKEAILHAAAQQRFHFPFGNPIDLGTLLCISLLSLPVLHGLAKQREEYRALRLGLFVSAIAQCYTLLFTRSRTPLPALLLGALMWVYGMSHRITRRTVAIMGLFLGLAILAVLLMPGGLEMLQRAETVRARVIFWEASLRMTAESPLLGMGIGGYGSNYPHYRGLTAHQTIYPHNIILEIMTDMGGIGLLLALYVFACYFQFLMPRKDKPLEQNWAAIAAASFLLCCMAGFHQNMLGLTGWIAAWIAAGCRGEASTVADQASSRPAAPREARQKRTISFIAIALLAASSMIPSIARETGHYFYEKGSQQYAEKGDPLGAMRSMEKAVFFWRPLSDAWSYLAGLRQSAQDSQGAEACLIKAIHWSPTSAFLHEQMAETLLMQSRKTEALAEIDKAIQLHPVKWNYYDTRARVLYQLGQRREAANSQEQARRLKEYEPRYDEAVEAIRKQAGQGSSTGE